MLFEPCPYFETEFFGCSWVIKIHAVNLDRSVKFLPDEIHIFVSGHLTRVTPMNDDLVLGEDGQPRCGWGISTPDYVLYHDNEWGRPVIDERTLFEKMCLEGFQSGLSWLTILRKRESFREVFLNFEAEPVSEFEEPDILRLLDDARIIRHRGKIEATINNAKILVEMHESDDTLADMIWSFAPALEQVPKSMGDVAGFTPESTALSKALKKRGFKFVGPTTAYAAMQAMGVVGDHLEGCCVRQACEAERAAIISARC